MTAEAVMRTVALLTCATTLSLFSTIVAYAAVNVAPLRWDGSMCTAQHCGSMVSMIEDVRGNSSRSQYAIAFTQICSEVVWTVVFQSTSRVT